MPHVFVIRGDIAHLACGAWILPTSAAVGVRRWEKQVDQLLARVDTTDLRALRSRQRLTAVLADGAAADPVKDPVKDPEMVPLGTDAESVPVLGRWLEIFLDALLCFASDVHGYLLHSAFDAALEDPERRLRPLLLDLERDADPAVRETAPWRIVQEALERLGRARPGNG